MSWLSLPTALPFGAGKGTTFPLPSFLKRVAVFIITYNSSRKFLCSSLTIVKYPAVYRRLQTGTSAISGSNNVPVSHRCPLASNSA